MATGIQDDSYHIPTKIQHMLEDNTSVPHTSRFASVSLFPPALPSVPVIAVLVSLGVRTDHHLGGVPLRRTGVKSVIGLHI